MAKDAYAWLRQLIWPANDAGPLDFVTGVTWIELGLSFMFFTSKYLPILRRDNLGNMRLIYPANYSSAKTHGMTMIEAGTMMQRVVDNLTSLIPEEVWPSDTQRQKVSAIYRLGAHRFHQVINRRPTFPHQAAVVEVIQKAVSCGQVHGLDTTPSVDSVCQRDQIAPGTWQFRIDRAKVAMKYARAKRLLL